MTNLCCCCCCCSIHCVYEQADYDTLAGMRATSNSVSQLSTCESETVKVCSFACIIHPCLCPSFQSASDATVCNSLLAQLYHQLSSLANLCVHRLCSQFAHTLIRGVITPLLLGSIRIRFTFTLPSMAPGCLPSRSLKIAVFSFVVLPKYALEIL